MRCFNQHTATLDAEALHCPQAPFQATPSAADSKSAPVLVGTVVVHRLFIWWLATVNTANNTTFT